MKRLIVAIACIVALTAAYVGQAQKGKLATLIQNGDRKAALDMIRSGADVNEAQPDGTRPVHWKRCSRRRRRRMFVMNWDPRL